MKIDSVGTRVDTDVVDAAQEVVRVAMRLVRSARGEHRGPTPGDFVCLHADAQESQNAVGAAIDAGNEFAKLLAFMQGLH